MLADPGSDTMMLYKDYSDEFGTSIDYILFEKIRSIYDSTTMDSFEGQEINFGLLNASWIHFIGEYEMILLVTIQLGDTDENCIHFIYPYLYLQKILPQLS